MGSETNFVYSCAGHSRSLLEAANGAVVPRTLEVVEGDDDDMTSELDVPLIQALTDHDYVNVAKQSHFQTLAKTPAYYVPPVDDFPPQHGKPDSGGGGGGGGGFPPDGDPGAKLSAKIIDTVNHVSNNFSDPGGKLNSNSQQTLVVNLQGQGRQPRLRDDIELE